MLILEGATSPWDVGKSLAGLDSVYNYWTHGRLLDELATCVEPAIEGLRESPFSTELHDEAERFANYRRSTLQLTDFGHALLAEQSDFTRRNPISRWWGGTHLTNSNLWRWHPHHLEVIAPGH